MEKENVTLELKAKYILAFTEEEKPEFDLANKAGDLACCLTDIKNLLRGHYKWGSDDFGKEKEEYITKVYERVCDIINEYQLGNDI